MALEKITSVKGTGVYVAGDEIDTDRIIPARFMKCVTFDDLGQYAFYDARKNEDGSDTDHILNKAPYDKAPILLSGKNFGCGSSREHAPQSLFHWGIRAVIAESFAEIFFGNCTTLGIPCLMASGEDIRKIATILEADPTAELVIDVAGKAVTCKDLSITVTTSDAAHDALINGRWDAIGELLEADTSIVAKANGYID